MKVSVHHAGRVHTPDQAGKGDRRLANGPQGVPAAALDRGLVPLIGRLSRGYRAGRKPLDPVGAPGRQNRRRRNAARIEIPVELHFAHRPGNAQRPAEAAKEPAAVKMLQVNFLPVDIATIDAARWILLDQSPVAPVGMIQFAKATPEQRRARLVGKAYCPRAAGGPACGNALICLSR